MKVDNKFACTVNKFWEAEVGSVYCGYDVLKNFVKIVKLFKTTHLEGEKLVIAHLLL